MNDIFWQIVMVFGGTGDLGLLVHLHVDQAHIPVQGHVVTHHKKAMELLVQELVQRQSPVMM